MNTLNKLFLAVVGGTAMTYESAQNLIVDMIDKGKVSVDEGKDLADELKKTVKREENVDTTPVEEEQKAQLAEELLLMRQELNELKRDVAELKGENEPEE